VDIAPLRQPPDQAAALELLQSGFRYALSLSHHQHDAEDLAQEAWLKLCVRYGGAISRAALFTTIRNLFIDRCRRANVLGFDSCDDEPLDLTAPENASPGTLADLDGLLAGLRPGEREAIYLHYVEGHTAEEVGVLTHKPRGSVLSLLHRALHKLKIAAATSTLGEKRSDPQRNQ
jgi:RNA polymerase sigma-70 factor (ECF subfamily)